MNSLSALANIGTPPPSPARSRTGSESNLADALSRPQPSRLANDATASLHSVDDHSTMPNGRPDAHADAHADASADPPASHYDDKASQLDSDNGPFDDVHPRTRWFYPKRISLGIVGAVGVLLSPIVYTSQYLVACFYYDDDARFSLVAPAYHVARSLTRPRRSKPATKLKSDASRSEKTRRPSTSTNPSQSRTRKIARRSPSIASSSAIATDSELDEQPPSRGSNLDSPSRHTRSKSNASSTGEEIAPAKRSIRIKLHNEDALRQRKAAKKAQSETNSAQVSPEAAAALKSPTGPVTASKQMTRFPRAPQPPRPLVPRRQPSYSASGVSAVGPHQKTLILDLDETLIHSMAKGGRFQTGHMVEVKLQASVGAGGQIIGPQVPILYYVHKRPYCDDFLKKISKWYNLIIFTASVQEYADPVIDWLEVERKYFAGRYYRQHCTFRNGAYIKDLAQVEPDLSKVMILDNSPMSYIFHEDNAIPIEGWISDPTDNDLLHLIPLLEGLQYTTDVRALLALRQGMPAST
jgi:CTD nuclear envelope phosphatase 1